MIPIFLSHSIHTGAHDDRHMAGVPERIGALLPLDVSEFESLLPVWQASVLSIVLMPLRLWNERLSKKIRILNARINPLIFAAAERSKTQFQHQKEEPKGVRISIDLLTVSRVG